MAPQLDEAQRLLIKTLLKKGFDTKLIASKALCSVRTVQRIRRERDKLPTRRTARRGRRSCIAAPMQEALRNKLAERSDIYQCEMADFLYRKFRKRISERSIGRTLRSIGWTRKTIRRSRSNGTLTFEIIIYIGYRSTSPTNLYLLMSLAAIEGPDTGDGGGLQRGPPQSRLRSSVAERDGTFFRPTRQTASCYGEYTRDQQIVICSRTS